MSRRRRLTATSLISDLRAQSDATKRAVLQRFFRTGLGEYGEGDVFLGVTVPQVRRSIRSYRDLPLAEVERLLGSTLHEVRMAGLLLLVEQFRRGDKRTRSAIARFYLERLDAVNNWDLVDCSAPHILGTWLQGGDAHLLTQLARSGNLWQQRIAIIATQAFIRSGHTSETFRLALILLRHPHDLIHKAVGWMLREAGKHDAVGLEQFLTRHAASMPRTMLRYAIEKLTPAQRRRFMTIPRQR